MSTRTDRARVQTLILAEITLSVKMLLLVNEVLRLRYSFWTVSRTAIIIGLRFTAVVRVVPTLGILLRKPLNSKDQPHALHDDWHTGSRTVERVTGQGGRIIPCQAEGSASICHVECLVRGTNVLKVSTGRDTIHGVWATAVHGGIFFLFLVATCFPRGLGVADVFCGREQKGRWSCFRVKMQAVCCCWVVSTRGVFTERRHIFLDIYLLVSGFHRTLRIQPLGCCGAVRVPKLLLNFLVVGGCTFCYFLLPDEEYFLCVNVETVVILCVRRSTR